MADPKKDDPKKAAAPEPAPIVTDDQGRPLADASAPPPEKQVVQAKGKKGRAARKPEDGPPHRDDAGRLTYHGAKTAIERGGSVLWQGEVVDDVDDLPDEAEFAAGDAQAEKALADSLDRQIADLSAQRARVKGK